MVLHIGVMKEFLQNSDVQVLAVCDVVKEANDAISTNETLGREPAKRIVEEIKGNHEHEILKHWRDYLRSDIVTKKYSFSYSPL